MGFSMPPIRLPFFFCAAAPFDVKAVVVLGAVSAELLCPTEKAGLERSPSRAWTEEGPAELPWTLASGEIREPPEAPC